MSVPFSLNSKRNEIPRKCLCHISKVTIESCSISLKLNKAVIEKFLAIATPLILSTASLTLMLFVDRMFLAWYSQSAVAAATPGGITYFTICSFFMGTAQYVNTLVAQFHGAAKKPSCARAVWQGIWFSVASAPIILASISIGNRIFEWSGHGPNIVQMEKDFFSILMVGGILLPLNASLSSFFSGRGKTITVDVGELCQAMLPTEF